MHFGAIKYTFLFLLISITTTFSQNIEFEIDGNGPPTVIIGSNTEINAIVTPVNPNYIYTWDNITTNTTIQTGPLSAINVVINERTTFRVRVTNGQNQFERFIDIAVLGSANPGFDGFLQICNQSGTIDLFNSIEGNPDPGGAWIPPLSGGNGIFVIGQDPVQEYRYVVPGTEPHPNVSVESKVVIEDCRDKDNDGDGVLDDVDLDDDNDGILDKVENAVCSDNSLIEIDSILDLTFGQGFTPTTNINVIGHKFSGIWPDDGFYCVGTSTFLGSVPQNSGAPATFIMTNANNNEDADGDVNGRYLAININSKLINNPIFELKDISVEAGERYRFRIDMAGLCERCPQVPILNLEIIDQNLPPGSPPIFSTTSANIGIQNDDVWNRVPLTFQATSNTLLSLVIRNFQTDGNNGNDLGIDNIKYAPLACDFDRDEIPNFLDLDSDNDGVFDIIEAGNPNVIDANNDGIADGPVDANGVPVSANGGTTAPLDTDGLEFSNYLDIDSDNDGIQDNIESQTTADYIAPSGNDIDINGVDDIYYTNIILPIDTDSDGTPDYLDLNSDNDCLSDNIEAFDFDQDGEADTERSGVDIDFDGLDDNYDNVILNLINSVSNPTDDNEVPTDLPDNNAPGKDVDFRDDFIFADPGTDGSKDTCTIDGLIDLFDLLGGTPEPGGTWFPTLASGTSIFNPTIDPPGVYTYSIVSIGICTDVSAQVVITVNEPFNLPSCNLSDETIECEGDLNETLADQWHQNNLNELINCIDNTNLLITHNYIFTNIVTTCGSGGEITVTYSIIDECGNPSSIDLTLTIQDTTPPDIESCTAVVNETIECAGDLNEANANAWNQANINALRSCAIDECNDNPDNYVIISNYNFDEIILGNCGDGDKLEVTYTISDGCENNAIRIATLTIFDTTGPQIITNIPTQITLVCTEVTDPQQLEFTDECHDEDIDIEFTEVNEDLGDGSDYQIIRTWTVNDKCSNTEIYTQTIDVINETLLNEAVREACFDDGVIDLFTFLPVDTDTTGEWVIVSTINDDIEVVDGIFDPTELDQKEDLGDYVFSYTITKEYCLENTKVTITLNDECIPLDCGLQDFTISKTLTPNGDEFNQFFKVTSVKECGFNINVKIFNRYGTIVYQNDNYQNDWSGDTHGSSIGGANQLPNGSYYYVIVIQDSGIKPLSGPIFIGTR